MRAKLLLRSRALWKTDDNNLPGATHI